MQIIAVSTIHVDDLVVAAKRACLENAYRHFLAKFGKLKRQSLPFTTVGMEDKRTADGGLMLTQVAYAEALKPLEVHESLDKPSTQQERRSCEVVSALCSSYA